MAERTEQVSGVGQTANRVAEPPTPPRPNGNVTAQRAAGEATSDTATRPGDGVLRKQEEREAKDAQVTPLLQALTQTPAADLSPEKLQGIATKVDAVEAVVKALEANKGKMPEAQFKELGEKARTLLRQASAELKGESPKPPDTSTGPDRPPEKEDYEKKVGFLKFGPQKNVPGQGLLADIERHLPARYGTTYRDSDPVTWGHETTHGINSHLRNTGAYNPSGRKVNGFYVGDDKAIVLPEPPIRKSEVAPYIPQSLRGGRFGQYVTGQRAFENEPLYLMDEWTAYTNGGAVGVELAKAGQWRQGGRDAVAGVVEFTGYGFGVARAIEAKNPGYLDRNPDLKNFVAWQGLRAMDTFREGMKISDFNRFPGQQQYLRNFQTSPDAEPMRDFIRQQYGEAYLQRLLYGSP